MQTDDSKNERTKEKQLEPDKSQFDPPENINVELNRIEAETEETHLENHNESDEHHPQFITPQSASPRVSFGDKVKRALKSKKFWAIFISLVLATGIALWFIDPVRWWALTMMGQRTTLHIHAIAPGEANQADAELKNVQVVVNNRQFLTDQNGKVTITDQPYGKAEIKATKQGYADATATTTLDFNPFFTLLGSQEADEAAQQVHLELKAIGVAASFKIIDFLSSQPITTGQFNVGDLTVKPDEQGIVSFKAPAQDSNKVQVVSSMADKYINKTFEVTIGNKEDEVPNIVFVPAGKHYFMSKRDGALGIYSSNLDGTDIQQLIPGTGKESSTTAFTVSPSGKYGVLASTRDGVRNDKNILLHRIYVIDLEKKQMTRVDEAPSFEFADWSGDTLVYNTLNTEGSPSAKLRTIEVSSKKLTDIASSYGFGRKIISLDQVVFTQFDQNDSGEVKAQVRRADLKTSAVKDLHQNVSAYNIVQNDFDRVAFQTLTDQKWHEFNFNTSQLKDVAQPTEQNTQTFLSTANNDNTKRLLIDRIDGKFTLITKTTADAAEKQLYGTGGLGGPVRWIGDVIVFRVITDRETADYAISTKGGEPKKIADVTATASTQGTANDPNLFRYY